MKNKNLFPIVIAILLGILCATWRDIIHNETAVSIAAASFFISAFSLVYTLYFTVDNALELRGYHRKKLFSDYCARFSNDQNINKVAEWLFTGSIVDSNGNIKIYPKKLSIYKDKGHTEPTPFEKERFWEFLVEINIQIKDKQIVREDAMKVFSIYANMFDKVVIQPEEQTSSNRIRTDIEELLSEQTK